MDGQSFSGLTMAAVPTVGDDDNDDDDGYERSFCRTSELAYRTKRKKGYGMERQFFQIVIR